MVLTEFFRALAPEKVHANTKFFEQPRKRKIIMNNVAAYHQQAFGQNSLSCL